MLPAKIEQTPGNLTHRDPPEEEKELLSEGGQNGQDGQFTAPNPSPRRPYGTLSGCNVDLMATCRNLDDIPQVVSEQSADFYGSILTSSDDFLSAGARASDLGSPQLNQDLQASDQTDSISDGRTDLAAIPTNLSQRYSWLGENSFNSCLRMLSEGSKSGQQSSARRALPSCISEEGLNSKSPGLVQLNQIGTCQRSGSSDNQDQRTPTRQSGPPPTISVPDLKIDACQPDEGSSSFNTDQAPLREGELVEDQASAYDQISPAREVEAPSTSYAPPKLHMATNRTTSTTTSDLVLPSEQKRVTSTQQRLPCQVEDHQANRPQPSDNKAPTKIATSELAKTPEQSEVGTQEDSADGGEDPTASPLDNPDATTTFLECLRLVLLGGSLLAIIVYMLTLLLPKASWFPVYLQNQSRINFQSSLLSDPFGGGERNLNDTLPRNHKIIKI